MPSSDREEDDASMTSSDEDDDENIYEPTAEGQEVESAPFSRVIHVPRSSIFLTTSSFLSPSSPS